MRGTITTLGRSVMMRWGTIEMMLRAVLARLARSERRRIDSAMDASFGKSGDGDDDERKVKRVGRVGAGIVERGRVGSWRVEDG